MKIKKGKPDNVKQVTRVFYKIPWLLCKLCELSNKEI